LLNQHEFSLAQRHMKVSSSTHVGGTTLDKCHFKSESFQEPELINEYRRPDLHRSLHLTGEAGMSSTTLQRVDKKR
jgi:hypothetical protein